MRQSVFVLILIAVAIAWAEGPALGDGDHVVILKCAEENAARIEPIVWLRQASNGFDFPSSCSLNAPCAQCLRDLVRKRDCEGDDVFTSNVVVDQPSNPPQNIAIDKYVFTCEDD